jgi:hypothetical protein
MYRTLAVNKDYAENNFRLPRLFWLYEPGHTPLILKSGVLV